MATARSASCRDERLRPPVSGARPVVRLVVSHARAARGRLGIRQMKSAAKAHLSAEVEALSSMRSPRVSQTLSQLGTVCSDLRILPTSFISESPGSPSRASAVDRRRPPSTDGRRRRMPVAKRLALSRRHPVGPETTIRSLLSDPHLSAAASLLAES
jgi:hypothetical protein